jgi:serine/threonine protein kinase
MVRPLPPGAVGAVYLARDLALHRTVAIKVLRCDLRENEDACERFRREARLLARLNHPNIVPVHALGETPEIMYIVMRYVHGESLAERMRREGRLPHDEARRILAELALALDYAHRQGIVHRDLKPENILLDHETGRPMVADFGVATHLSWHPAPEELRLVFGTPHFMSPEQALGQVDIDGRSDLYALGVLGYQMLSGRLPFEGQGFAQIVARHVTETPAPLAPLAGRAPADLVASIERCLAKDPEDRWRTARDLHAALTTRRGRPVLAWPWVAAIVAAATALIGSVAV